MSMFEPIGEVSRKELALKVLVELRPGDVVSYERLEEAVGTSDRPAVQAAVRDAAKVYLRSHGRAVEAVRGEGYRVVEPDGHARIAEKRRERSRRELVKAHDVVTFVDVSEMSVDGRRAAEGLQAVLAAQMAFNQRMDARLRSAERATEAVAVRTDQTEAEVAALKERLERLERAS